MKMMLLFFFLSLLCVGCFGWKKGDLEKYGPFKLALNMVSCNHDKTLNLNVSGIRVHFYDFANGTAIDFPVNKSAQGILSLPKLDKKKKIFLFVAGFQSSINENIVSSVREAFKTVNNSYLIIIDHSPYTNNKTGLKDGYERSVRHVYYIGKQLGEILIKLYQGGVSPTNIHCIGHSLGSHILGHAGIMLTNKTGQRLMRITALDPAGPCFSDEDEEYEHVRSGAAKFVEVYHCNAGVFGSTRALGDVDFYVNKGLAQPECRTPWIPDFILSPKAARCSHKECVVIWLKSIVKKDRYKAYKCESYEHFKSKNCAKNTTIAGFWNPGNINGTYYFSTKKSRKNDSKTKNCDGCAIHNSGAMLFYSYALIFKLLFIFFLHNLLNNCHFANSPS